MEVDEREDCYGQVQVLCCGQARKSQVPFLIGLQCACWVEVDVAIALYCFSGAVCIVSKSSQAYVPFLVVELVLSIEGDMHLDRWSAFKSEKADSHFCIASVYICYEGDTEKKRRDSSFNSACASRALVIP